MAQTRAATRTFLSGGDGPLNSLTAGACTRRRMRFVCAPPLLNGREWDLSVVGGRATRRSRARNMQAFYHMVSPGTGGARWGVTGCSQGRDFERARTGGWREGSSGAVELWPFVIGNFADPFSSRAGRGGRHLDAAMGRRTTTGDPDCRAWWENSQFPGTRSGVRRAGILPYLESAGPAAVKFY